MSTSIVTYTVNYKDGNYKYNHEALTCVNAETETEVLEILKKNWAREDTNQSRQRDKVKQISLNIR